MASRGKSWDDAGALNAPNLQADAGSGDSFANRVLESLTSLEEQFSDMQVQFSDMQWYLSDMQVQFSDMQVQFSDMQVQFSDMQGQFSTMQGQISSLTDDLDERREKSLLMARRGQRVTYALVNNAESAFRQLFANMRPGQRSQDLEQTMLRHLFAQVG